MNREPILSHGWWWVWKFGFVSPLWLIQTWVRTQPRSVNTLPGVTDVLHPACSVHSCRLSETIAARRLFPDFLPSQVPSTDVWLDSKENSPEWNIPDLLSCQLRPLLSSLSKVRIIFFAGFFQNSTSSYHVVYIAHSNKGVVGWFPEFYINLGSILLSLDVSDVLYLYLYFLKSVCGMRLGKFPRFLVGWRFLWCILFYSFQLVWKEISVNLLIHHCISRMPQKHF